jgi:hypothetical protein
MRSRRRGAFEIGDLEGLTRWELACVARSRRRGGVERDMEVLDTVVMQRSTDKIIPQ